jgi:hypothetical protein
VHFTFGAAIPRPLLVAAHQTTGAGTNTGVHLYFFYSCIGNLLYCFELSPTCMRENIIVADLRLYAWPHRGHPSRRSLSTGWRQRLDLTSARGCAEWRRGGVICPMAIMEQMGQEGPKEGRQAPPPARPRGRVRPGGRAPSLPSSSPSLSELPY